MIPGRWLLRVPPGKDVFLNSVPAQFGVFLVPELSGNWRVLDGEGTAHQGKTTRKLDPEEVEADSIRTMGGHLDVLVREDATWTKWLEVVPLEPGMSDAVDLLPLEQLIRKLFGHLEAVCMKPRAHLHVEVERVPVAKARRLPIKAASHLASHTEDWERPLIRGVLPKRILSEVRQDQVDIYENRVAARLIDHLVVYLGKRIRVIRKLLKVFRDKEDYSKAVGGTHFRQERISKLWGESIEANEGRRRAEATLKELEWLKYSLMGLMDSPLYRHVPRRTDVAPTMRTTNILTNDQNYRRVGELWRTWVNAGHAETTTPADVNREAQELCSGIGSFALLLVVRALHQLGYEIRDKDKESPVMMSGRWMLEGHGTIAECEWDDAGRVSIAMGGSRLAVVALPVCLGTAASDKQVQEVLEQVVKAVDDPIGRTIVLYAGDADEPGEKLSQIAQRRIHTIGNDPRTQLGDRIGFLPVSPWDIGSVERVSRAIRWFADSERFNFDYPQVIKVSPEAHGVFDVKAAGAWLETGEGGGSIIMRRPPRECEWKLLKLDQIVKKACEEHQSAFAEHKRLSRVLREAVRKHKTGTLNQQKKTAHRNLESAKRRKGAVERLRDDLVQARAKEKSLLVCPACRKPADLGSDFRPSAKNDCFTCDCQGCKTRWGTRMCEKGHRYAVMLPGGKFVEPSGTNESGWEDRTYGSDLLALPGRIDKDPWGFVCPNCGEIS